MKYRLPQILESDLETLIELGSAKIESVRMSLTPLEGVLVVGSGLIKNDLVLANYISASLMGLNPLKGMVPRGGPSKMSLHSHLSELVVLLLYSGIRNRYLPDEVAQLTYDDFKTLGLVNEEEIAMLQTTAEDYLLRCEPVMRSVANRDDFQHPLSSLYEMNVNEMNMRVLCGLMYVASSRIIARNKTMDGRYVGNFDVLYSPDSPESIGYLNKKSVHVGGEDLFTIGRDPRSVLEIAGRDISRHHCQIVCRDGAYFLRDTSGIGTVVGPKDDQILLHNSEIELEREMVFYVGGTKVEFFVIEGDERGLGRGI